ncbi:hypothetical protein EBZ80_06250 [bacterium]|nr:hypothetical protein [bacterium]
MRAEELGLFAVLTIGLTLGLGVVMAAGFRTAVAANWEAHRCDPGVVPIAGLFKPAGDPRSAGQFATDNARDCQKVYVQNALRSAAAGAKELAEGEAAVVGVAGEVVGVLTAVFKDLWQVCYEAYSTFMERMRGVAGLFRNFLVGVHGMVERLQAAALSIVFGLIGIITASVSAVQVALIVAIVIVGILIALQVILFFLLLPISGLIITVTAIISVVVVAVATAVAAATVAELFTPGVCFAAGTQVLLRGGTSTIPIEAVGVGELLADGGRVTAVHRFQSADALWELGGVRVTGDHLVYSPELVAVSAHPAARRVERTWAEWLWRLGTWRPVVRDLWCLTTTTRRIPVRGNAGSILFADWEELAEGDLEGQRDWHAEVWRTLNGPAVPPDRPTPTHLDATAALAPDTYVIMGAGPMRRIEEVRIGDKVRSPGGHSVMVVGRVEMRRMDVGGAVSLGEGGPVVSAGCWVRRPTTGVWAPAATEGRFVATHNNPSSYWYHLYVSGGAFLVTGSDGTTPIVEIRDASDVGLERLCPLVENIVLAK